MRIPHHQGDAVDRGLLLLRLSGPGGFPTPLSFLVTMGLVRGYWETVAPRRRLTHPVRLVAVEDQQAAPARHRSFGFWKATRLLYSVPCPSSLKGLLLCMTEGHLLSGLLGESSRGVFGTD